MQDLEGYVTSVVLVGKFNPAIFSPAWLSKVGLITDEQFEAATIEIVHSDIAKFQANDLRYEVLSNRFQIQMTGDPAIRTCDMASAIFGRLLPHTPILQAGINFEVQFATASLLQRTNFGRALAPTAPWGSFGERIAKSEGKQIGGMLSLSMRELGIPGRENGWRQVKIEPSGKGRPETGVAVHINDHFETYSDDADVIGAKKTVMVLQENFDESISEAKRIVSDLIKFSEGLPS